MAYKHKIPYSPVGSYVVTIYSPLEDSEPGNQLDIETESFSRLVLTTLLDSLNAIHKAVVGFDDNQQFSDFFRAVEVGVSSNMCDALANMGGRKRSYSVTLGVIPSPLRPIADSSHLDYSFNADELTIIAQAADRLRQKNIIPSFEVVGIIDKLKRGPRDRFGIVTIHADVDGRMRHVNVQLAEADYSVAVDAHRVKSRVSCVGTLHVAPRISNLLNPRAFKVIDQQLFD